MILKSILNYVNSNKRCVIFLLTIFTLCFVHISTKKFMLFSGGYDKMRLFLFLKKLHLTVLWIVVDTLYNLATQIIKFNGFHYSQRTVQAKECLHHPKKNPSSCLVSVILVPPLSSSYQWQWLVSFLSLCRAILLISYE
jgi:hypothetical protein